MAQTSIFDDQLFRLFAQIDISRTLIITANKRLSRFINERYARFQQLQNEEKPSAFAAINCLSFGGWLQQLWRRMLLTGDAQQVLLTPVQELLLWENVIESHPASPALLNISATARMASEAWRLINDWRWDAEQAIDPVFAQWAEAFRQQSLDHQQLSASQATAAITETINSGKISASENLLPKNLLLYGFDEQTPAMQTLLQACTQRGCVVETMNLAVPGATVRRYEFQNDEQELRAAAEWARDQVVRNPLCRIGIVVPELVSRRAQVERIFNRVFDPGYIFPAQAQHATGFNMSAGQPLAQMPVIWACQQLLQWNRDPLELDAVSKLLLSPFWGVTSELNARAAVDLKLRELGELQISLQQLKAVFAEACEETAGEGEPEQKALCPDTWHRLSEFDRLRRKTFVSSTLPSRWCSIWIEQLQALGWPGQRRLDSLEYQQVQSWQHSLEDFQSLDHVLSDISHARALQAFTKLLTESRFQPQTRTSPVQILGILEAAGLPFDALWMTNLDDETWPQAPSPNPLLALSEQIERQLPQCSAERELAYAERLTARLISCTREMVFSCARSNGDKQLSCSQLVVGYCADVAPFELMPDLSQELEQRLFASRDMDILDDYRGAAVAHPETIRGGSQILKSQSACPFQAFARHRLHTEQPEIAQTGLSAAERGNLVHAILENVWHKLKNQQQLLALTDSQLDQLIADCVDAALVEIRHRRFVGERFLTMECSRLQALTRAWLELEKQRQPFTVAFNERSRTVELKGMPIHIRYDRVDLLDDNSLLVLDYKTGKPNIRDWGSERPDEPQVPLYAIANQDLVSGAAFGLISDDEVVIKGIAEDDAVAPGLVIPEKLKYVDLPANWRDILAHWRSVLEQLAADFLAGHAEVAPKQRSQTCRYCELQPLCRIQQQADDLISDENTIAGSAKGDDL